MSGGADGYAVARQNLVRVITALGGYRRDAIVIVGAQAVYLQTEERDSPFLPFTLDSDLAVDPRILEATPPIQETLKASGYQHRDDQPGLYWAPGSSDEQPLDGAKVDILVPEEFAQGTGRRDAGLPGDNRGAARRTAGLEAALYDKDLRWIAELTEPERRVEAYVAGPAALIIAKAWKIADRGDERLKAKDASDVFSLLRAFESAELTERFAMLSTVTEITASFEHGVSTALDVFVNGSRGRQLFSEALRDDQNRDELLESYRYLAEDLGSVLARFGSPL
jgi:hypothetical protein